MEALNIIYLCVGVTLGAILMYILIFMDKIWIKLIKYFHKKY